MKQMKIWMVALTLVIGFSFTSCVNSDNDYADDWTYVTTNDMYPYDATLYGDNGIRYTPSNPSMLRLNTSDEQYAKRAIISFNYAEGEVVTADKKSYKIDILEANGIAVKNLNTRPDTLENAYAINDLTFWAINGYITTVSDLYVVNNYDLDLYVDYETLEEEGGKDNIVPMVLQHTKGGSEFGGSANARLTVSWPVPGYGNLYEYGINLSDTVVFKISAKNSSSSELTRTYKYKY